MATMEHVKKAGFEPTDIQGVYMPQGLKLAHECRYGNETLYAWAVHDEKSVRYPESVVVTAEPRFGLEPPQYVPLKEVEFMP